MYQLPNKIFSQWAESIDNSLDYLVEEVIAWQEEPDFEGKKLSREDILRFFQEVSLNMLLNLYYVASSHGANDNTVDYLAQQNYISPSLNYRIERLMSSFARNTSLMRLIHSVSFSYAWDHTANSRVSGL